MNKSERRLGVSIPSPTGKDQESLPHVITLPHFHRPGHSFKMDNGIPGGKSSELIYQTHSVHLAGADEFMVDGSSSGTRDGSLVLHPRVFPFIHR